MSILLGGSIKYKENFGLEAKLVFQGVGSTIASLGTALRDKTTSLKENPSLEKAMTTTVSWAQSVSQEVRGLLSKGDLLVAAGNSCPCVGCGSVATAITAAAILPISYTFIKEKIELVGNLITQHFSF